MTIRSTVFFLLASGVVVFGCKDKESATPRDSKSEYVFDCKVGIAKKMSAAEYSANESDKDEKVAAEKAWRAVCAKLPPEEQANCRDDKRWSPSVGTMKMSTNVETKFGVTVKLTPNLPRVWSNEIKSEVGHEPACAEATKKACAAAGAAADCVATGAFEKKEELKGKTHRMLLGGR